MEDIHEKFPFMSHRNRGSLDKTMDLDRKILLKINKQINKIERCIAF